MKVELRNTVIVEATKQEWFNTFSDLPKELQRKYFVRFRALICSEPHESKTVFIPEEWDEISKGEVRDAQ